MSFTLSKVAFIPDSTCERHQKYFGAFSVVPKRFHGSNNTYEYLKFITQYINDGAISHLDSDDLQFFRDLLFESSFGKVHIEYYDWIITKWSQFAFSQTVSIIARYADFLGQLSELFLKDLFKYVYSLTPRGAGAKHLFPLLSPENKVIFVQVGMDYPHILQEIPKFKLYLLFS
jgi:hypothetical protein